MFPVQVAAVILVASRSGAATRGWWWFVVPGPEKSSHRSQARVKAAVKGVPAGTEWRALLVLACAHF